MNVLRFPIQLRTGKNQFMREQRLKERNENTYIPDENKNSINNETTNVGTFRLFSLINNILNIKFKKILNQQ